MCIRDSHSSETMLEGSLFVSSGLGGMSGAQGKAVEMCNGVGIIAEVDESKIELRQRLGWVSLRAESCEEAFSLAAEWIEKKKPISIAYHGNIVDLLQYAVDHNVHIDFMTDQMCIRDRLSERYGYTIIHPYDDYQIIAGQGTLGLEIAEQLPDVRCV